jgi:hypothetical protein
MKVVNVSKLTLPSLIRMDRFVRALKMEATNVGELLALDDIERACRCEIVRRWRTGLILGIAP